MIVDLPGTTTNDVNKKITGLREEGGALTLSRVLTLVIALDGDDGLEDSIEAANFASREHPCRVIVVLPGDRKAAEPTLDAEIRVGADAGAGEVVVLRLNGELADHASSVVLPFLLPDTPVVAWWPVDAPAVPAQDPLGQLAIRRITDATNSGDPLAAIKSRAQSYTAGDYRSGVEPHHLLACAAGVGAGPGAVRAGAVGGGVGTGGRARARHPRRLAGRPDRRHGAARRR